MNKIQLLLVEDDASFAFIVKGSLELTGLYDVCVAANGKEGLAAYTTFQPNVIIADIEMPIMSGLEMVRQIRQNDRHTPILLATAKTSPQDLIEGYRVGVDNYIRKPFLPEELNAHIQAVLRRYESCIVEEKKAKDLYRLGAYLFNVKYHYLEWKEVRYELTERESGILQILYFQKGQLVRREDLLMRLWGQNDFYTSRSLDVFISKLRKYLSKDSSVVIQTIRGEGLRLEV